MENLGIDDVIPTQTEAETGDNATPPPVTPGENEVEASETTGTEAAQNQAGETTGEDVILVDEEHRQDSPEDVVVTDTDVSLAEVTIESPPAENEQQDDAPPLAAAEEEQRIFDLLLPVQFGGS